MYKICHSEQSSQRQRLIEKTLMDMLMEQPYSGISVSELCRRSDIPRKTFYRYFGTKDDVLHALLDHANQQMLYARPIHDGSMDRIEYFFHYWSEHRYLLDALMRNNLEALMVSQSIRYVFDERLGMDAAVHNATQMERSVTTIFAASGLLNLVLYCHREGWKHTPKEMARLTRKLMTLPLYRDSKVSLPKPKDRSAVLYTDE